MVSSCRDQRLNNGVDAAISKVQELINRDIALTRQTDETNAFQGVEVAVHEARNCESMQLIPSFAV